MENQTSEETQVDETTEPEEETQEEVDEETSEETVETETPKTQAVDYEAKFKASQEEAIRLKKVVDELKKPKSSSTGEPAKEPLDVDSILEVQTATRGLDSDEVEELRLRAKALGVPLTEARRDDNFVLWRDARKAKVAKDKALNPSTTQTEKEKPKTLEERLKNATFEEKGKILDEMGLNPMRMGTSIDSSEDFS